jgi:ATP-dependent exoDNAse (exonuclease V) alpha subunit
MESDLLERPETVDSIQLTQGQEVALEQMFQFMLDPHQKTFVLEGYSGCGKSTLVRTFIDKLPAFCRAAKLIDPKFRELEISMTATTNKAAENLARITGMEVATIHSFLGLRVQTDYSSGKTVLVANKTAPLKDGHLVFVDEASYVDSDLLSQIYSRTRNCKFIFVGDPAQLTPVHLTHAPVFQANFPTAKLTEVVRQAKGNPIVDLSTQFRHTVNTGVWPTFSPDGVAIKHLSTGEFLKVVEQEFTRPDWKYLDSKVLAWTNKTVIGYNHHINNLATGDPNFQVGDYAVCNSFTTSGRMSVKTDQMVQIMGIQENVERHGVNGKAFSLDNGMICFMPNKLEDKKARLRKARADEDYSLVSVIESEWIDLRSAFSQTINKSQGSTYDKVYIDLSDVARCNSGNQIARMLYVAISRARSQVFLTGDLA